MATASDHTKRLHLHLARVADGQIAEHWGSRDDLGLLGQLGLLEMQP